MEYNQAIVFPANGNDVTTVHPDFTHEAECVRSLGGNVIIIDMDEIAKGNVVATGVLDLEMSRDYDHCAINEDEVTAYLTSKGLPPAAYDMRCFFRLPEPVSGDFYQLMRWKLGIQLVEAYLNTADYLRMWDANVYGYKLEPLRGSGDKCQRQWWVNDELVLTVPADGASVETPSQSFLDEVAKAIDAYSYRSFFVLDIVKTKDSWAIGQFLEGQTIPLPQGYDLTPVFSALISSPLR